MGLMTPYKKKLFKMAVDKKLWLRPLGEVGNHQIWMVRYKDTFRHNYPRLLIVAGFHGEEKAGPLAVQRWLETFDPNLYRYVDVTFVPVVNPEGFDQGKRYGNSKEKTNCGFCHPENGDKPSQEGIILLKNYQLLKNCAKDGFLSLHEDLSETHFYVYGFERLEKPGKFTLGLRNELSKYFKEPLDGELVGNDATRTRAEEEVLAKDGIVWRLCDGSFEDSLFHDGTNRCAVSETPGQEAKLEIRIQAGVAVINKFIELSLECKKEEKQETGVKSDEKKT